MKMKAQYVEVCGMQLKYPRGKCIALNDYVINDEKTNNNDLNFHLKNLEKEEQFKLKLSTMKEIVKRINR